MKSDPKLISALNKLLSEELTAVNQYMLHSEMCAHWGYHELHEMIEARAIDEMRHCEQHISRILFLEGAPDASKYETLSIGQDVKEMIENDTVLEVEAVKSYNKVIALAGDLGDEATADYLVAILNDEERHVDWGEKQLVQIEQMGLDNYLANMASEE